MITTPKNKKIDLINSTGYFSYVLKDDNSFHRMNIIDVKENSPLLNFILNNEVDNSFKELTSNVFIKLIEKNINIKYCYNNDYIIKTNDINCPNKSGVLSCNRLNYIYYYYPEDKYTYNTISNELLRFAKIYISEKTEYNKNLFNKFVNVFNKYVIRLLNNNNEKYVICVVPSHEANQINNNTMSYVVDSVKKRYIEDYFDDGSDVIIRNKTISKSSLGEEKRTIQRQLESLKINNSELIKNRTILLIDDFYTSGSTMEACKELLLDNGAKEVIIFAFAKTRDVGWKKYE